MPKPLYKLALLLLCILLTAGCTGSAEPTETAAPVSMADIQITATDVTPISLTILHYPDGAFQSIDAVTDLNYWLEQNVDGQWQRLEPQSPDGLPIGDRTIHTVIDSDTDRHILNWSTLYGTLSSGLYRVCVNYYFQEENEARTLFANFTVSTDMTPDIFLSSITAEDCRCSAEFPPDIQQQYIFTRDQDAVLISLLSGLQPEDFFTGAAVDPQVVVTVSREEHPIWIFWDGDTTQFSFTFDHIRWAVRNDELNDFFNYLLQYSPANSTYEVYNVAPLNELPDTYSQEEAIIDQVVLINEGDIRDNGHVWEEFLKSANTRLPAAVRIMKYYSATDTGEAVKELYDLEFDGDSYLLHYVENGSIKTVPYRHLRNLTGQTAPDSDGAFQEYAMYCLTNQEPASVSPGFRERDRFAKPGDDPFMVWCDYSVRRNSLPVPEDVSKITLEVDLQPYITVTDPKVLDVIGLLFQEAEATYTPKTYFPGPVLRFHSADGIDLSLVLDLEDDLCIFNGQFYDYGSPDASMLPGLLDLMGSEGWPQEIVEHDAFRWYFDGVL